MTMIDGQGELILRLAAFFGLFALFALAEMIWPRRRLTRSKLRRWATNWGLSIFNSLTLRLLAGLAVPVAAVATAAWNNGQGFGLLHMIELPVWAELVIALVLFDLAIYGQHVAAHKINVLWRFHRVHHSDLDFDVTTAIRFHPVEIVVSMLYKMLLVLLIGPSVFAVILFEAILNGCAMFNHSNIKLPGWLDRSVRLFLVTPDMHRVHHSQIRSEHDSNYGFSISLWDRLFRTYTPQPSKGHDGMTIGLAGHQDEAPARFAWSLAFPFRSLKQPSGG